MLKYSYRIDVFCTIPTSAINLRSNVTTCSCPFVPKKLFPEHPPIPPLAAIQVSPGAFSSPIIWLLSSKTVMPTGTFILKSWPRRPKIRAFELSSPDSARITFRRYLKFKTKNNFVGKNMVSFWFVWFWWINIHAIAWELDWMK